MKELQEQKGYKILIVDNDEAEHGELQQFFINSGYGVIGAYDGAMGLQMADIHRPDLIVLEMDLPAVGGFRILEVVRERPELRQTPVIFVTRIASEILMIKALEHGADDYIVKPYNKLELLARVKSCLRRGKRFRLSEDSTSGSLADINLTDLLQTIELGKKTVHLNLPDMGADLFIEKGDLVHSRFGTFEGIPALQRILFLEYGSFSMAFEEPPKSITRTPMPIQYILMDTLRYVDELKRTVLEITEENNPLIQIKDTGVAEIEKLRDLSPLTLHDLIARMEDDLKENAGKVKGAFSRGKIVIV
jgi:DNA-binding response OmpR family regulator